MKKQIIKKVFNHYIKHDKFVSINEEKKGLIRINVTLKNGAIGYFDIMDIANNDGKKIDECLIHNGERLTDFHMDLKEISDFKVLNCDKTLWYKNFKDANDYYYFLLLHFIAHGVLFETFDVSDSNIESSFTSKVVIPTFLKIKEKYNLDPIIIKMYPENQTPNEDLFWWCYPQKVNDYLLKYAENNNLRINILDNIH